MGDVVQLPVRREQPRESEQETAPQRREAPERIPDRTPRRTPREVLPVVEPLWRESVGRELREERLASGKRLVDVAEEAGVSPQYLSEVERGLKDPSSELLAAIAGALGLSVAEIATRVASTSIAPQSPVCLAA
jgi:ribosome-binding protein aMBF1 (putative translation factor)